LSKKRNEQTVPPLELTLKGRRIVSDKEIDGCDICETAEKSYVMWPAKDADFTGFGNHELFFLCMECNNAAERGAFATDPADDDGWVFDNDGAVVWSGTPILDLYKDKFKTTTPATSALPAVPKGPPKCSKRHFDTITGPDGYGELRPSSSRGGMEMDNASDYAIFFDKVWREMKLPMVESWKPGHKDAPPAFEEEDTSEWPGTLFIDWPDWGSPPPVVFKYAKWVHSEWEKGKTIQFGCIGGHGRTGTFLAMVLLAGGFSNGDPADVTKWVHENYCKDAIESLGQKKAIVQMAESMGYVQPNPVPAK
jgi:hypothetical protein